MNAGKRNADFDLARLRNFARRLYPGTLEKLQVVPLRGGLECPSIAQVKGTVASGIGLKPFTFVVKRLNQVQQREAAVYSCNLHAGIAAPLLLGIDHLSPECSYIYLEFVHRRTPWPWGDLEASFRTLDALAAFHSLRTDCREMLQTWDYEQELQSSAQSSWVTFEGMLGQPEFFALKTYRRAFLRMISALPDIRKELLSSKPFGTTVIHGDVHPGNVLVRMNRGSEEPVLLDWARARMGSPLEDVSSWLESLGYWEPEAKRRHDTLLRHYLERRGVSSVLDRELRDLYWFAGLSNLLAGALRYYLYSAQTSERAAARHKALCSARDHLRVLRRADAIWSA